MAEDEQFAAVTYACGATCDLTEDDFVDADTDDYLGLLELLTDHHICENLAEDTLQAKKLLFQHLQQKEEYKTLQETGVEVAGADIRVDIIQALVEEHQKRRLGMLRIAEALEQILSEMSHERKAELKRYFPKLDEKFQKILTELKDESCPFIVAGETGSGKSQFLNLLTGHVTSNFLPVSNNPSTSCLCAIKYAEKDLAKIRAYRADSDEFVEEDVNEDNMAEKLARFTHQKEKRDKIEYTKVEVGCPLPWLKNGLTIYDSPGCGERREITAIVKQMLPKAYGFIYVLNTPSGGGIKTANLEEFWVSESSSGNSMSTDILQDSFDPRTAIFVFNKWDLVPQIDQEKVKEYVHSTLLSLFGDQIDHDSQVFYLSATQEAAALKGGYFTKGYKRILKGIESLLQQSFRCRITKYYNYLGKVLQRCNIVLTTFLNDSTSIKKTYKELKAKLNNLEDLSLEVEADLKKSLQTQTDHIISSLKEHIHNHDTKERLCIWDEEQCPMESEAWRLLKYEVNEKIQQRIAMEIKCWEHKSRIFEKAEDHLFITFGEKFETLTKHLYRAKTALVDHSTDDQALERILRELDKSLQPAQKKSMSLTKKVLIGFAAATILGGLIMGPIFLAQHIRRKNREQEMERKDWDYYSSFLGNRGQYPNLMSERMEAYISENLTGSVLRAAIVDQMTKLAQNYLLLLDDIPTFVEADKKLLRSRKRKRDLDMTEATRMQYLTMLSTLTKLQQKIEFFYFQHIYRNEVSASELYLEEEVGSGTFGVIWSAKLRPEDQEETKAFVKKLPVLLSEGLATNALAIMMEHTRLKQIQSENVIKYYGLCLKSTQCEETGESSIPYMVMEYSSQTLDMVRDSVKYNGPGMMRSTRKSHTVILEKMASYMMQIANGLVKMHDEDIVHHALKPSSILVFQSDSEEILKLCDFELTKWKPHAEQLPHNPECHSKMYSAPDIEKFALKKTDDLYSYGLIGLELYYGRCLCQMDFIKIDTTDRKLTFSSSPFQLNEPPPDIHNTLQNCLSDDPNQRPQANYCYDMFLKYAKDWFMGEVATSDVEEILQSFDNKSFMIFEDPSQQKLMKLCVKDAAGVRYHSISHAVTGDGCIRYSITDRTFKDLNSMVSFYETHNLHDSKDSGLLASR